MPKLSPSEEPQAPQASPIPEETRLISSKAKLGLDAAGVLPVVGNAASIGAAAVSAAEVINQGLRGNGAGAKDAAKDLALDLVGVIPVVGNVSKGAKAVVTGERALVLAEKMGPKAVSALEKAPAFLAKVEGGAEKGGALLAKAEQIGLDRSRLRALGQAALGQKKDEA